MRRLTIRGLIPDAQFRRMQLTTPEKDNAHVGTAASAVRQAQLTLLRRGTEPFPEQA